LAEKQINPTVPLENPESSERERIILLSEFSPPMPTSLLALLITLGSMLRSRLDLQLEIMALRHQIGVLERSVHKRPRLTSTDCLLWVSLYRFWRHWRSTLLIVTPETVVAWHRKGFRLFWRWKFVLQIPESQGAHCSPCTGLIHLGCGAWDKSVEAFQTLGMHPSFCFCS
jgi:hypothetical protein